MRRPCPWSFFDLSEIQLYLGSDADFLKSLDDGIFQPATRRWQARTHLESLQLLDGTGFKPTVVNQGLEKLKEATSKLPE